MKEKINTFLKPKNWIIVLGIFIIFFSLIYLIFFNGFGTPISYILYLIMSYSLIIISIKVYYLLKERINLFIDKNKYLSVYKKDHKLRYKISLFTSLAFNIIYVIFKLVSGIVFKSVWFISFAIYYLLLVILRTNIVKQELKHKTILKDEYLKYRKTAVILLFTNVILTIIILIIVNQKIMNIYPNWIAIAIAVYTFYLIYNSIYKFIKYRKYKSPLMSSAKVINIVTSLISLISLEIVLIPTFGVNNIGFFEIMIMATGGGIAIIIVIISLYMIIKSTEWLREN